jgi:hypothetical protein
MKKRFFLIILCIGFLGFYVQSIVQFTSEELAEREKWEEFLKEATIVEWDQPFSEREAATEPWRLKLEKDGVVKYAWWKNVEGRPKGYPDEWRWEIASYRLDKLLKLNMVPPCIEKRFQGERGSCSLEAEFKMLYREILEQEVEIPSRYILSTWRAVYLMKAWDNLIANGDRNWKDILVTEDWRVILIDHSRSFYSSKKYTNQLINRREGEDEPIRELPRAFVERLKSLTFEKIREAVGEYLKDKEINSVLTRRDLMLLEIERLIKKFGENNFLY